MATDTLNRLCRYYLECLSLDDDTGVSLFASSRYDLDYAELSQFDPENGIFQGHKGQEVTELLRRIHASPERKTPCIGYPVRLRKHTARSGNTFFFAEPVFLFPLVQDPESPVNLPHPTDDPPGLNSSVLRTFSIGGKDTVMQEAAELADELKLWDSDHSSSRELVEKLRELRPNWDWKEALSQDDLTSSPAISKISEDGIYNRAILFGVKQSPYTKGLENDLNKLRRIENTELADTALGYWLDDTRDAAPITPTYHTPGEHKPLLEPIPLNLEQRQAIESALNQRLSVVTGPPGTGKSQIVSALLMNAAIRNKRVLFASKNNKAVDVVEARVNSLGPRPVLMRLGNSAYQSQLAEYLAALLGGQVTEEDQQTYKEAKDTSKSLIAKGKEIQSELDRLITLRNFVDELDRASDDWRGALGEKNFARAAEIENLGDLEIQAAASVNLLVEASKNLQPLMTRAFWWLLRKKRITRFRESLAPLQALSVKIDSELPGNPQCDANMPLWDAPLRRIQELITFLQSAHTYHEQRILLSQASPLADFYRAIVENNEATSESSIVFWEAWLRLTPARLSSQARTDLGNYLAVLRLIVSANETSSYAGRQVFAKFNELFPKVANILSCWAVTSLSASGKIPLQPGFFDLLIIDEASQCDIASIVPLLYRAKSAVIIGDPKQLQHISTISPQRNRNLLVRHDLLASHARWNYSENSVYALASSIVGPGEVTMLLDHHRSHADIIGFSNQHFYEQRLRVATKYENLNTPTGSSSAVRWIDVSGKTTQPPSGSGAINTSEAEAVVEELDRLIIKQSYQGTVGVVTPFSAQATLITQLINKHPQAAVLKHRTELLAETAHKFQGDERDVIIFSPVVAKGITTGALGFLKKTGNLFNVAITRARASLVVVGDSSAASDSGVDYLCRFVEYAREASHTVLLHDSLPADELTEVYPKVTNPSQVSEWEHMLYAQLARAGVRTTPQFKVEKYTLDFALFDGERRLDIEVDGEKYHKAWNGEHLYRDQLRNMRMIELGWDVMRFWVYEIRDDMEGCIARVTEWINRQ